MAVFVIYHLLHFTTGTVHPSFDAHDVYGNVMTGFRSLACGAVLHGRHGGAWYFTCGTGYGACSRRLALINPKSDRFFRRLAAIATLAIIIGFIAIPMADCGAASSPSLGGVWRWNSTPTSPPVPSSRSGIRHRFEMKLVNPANKRRFNIIVVGSGLAGAAAAASLAELGYHVKCFCFQDSPRRAHSIAAQGGINAAKNYRNDGDSVYRLFYDTVKGGDYRSREANVYRLAQISVQIIDQCVAQGVPFAREYGGLLDTRSFGGAQVSRTFYCRGQTGQQLLLGAYQALARQISLGQVQMYPRTEMLDLVVIDGQARGIVTRNLVTGKMTSHVADAVVLGTGGYGNAYYLSTNAKGCNVTAIWRAHKRGAAFANPCFTQIHPTCIPVTGEHQSKLTLMSESLRNDGRIWVPKQHGRHAPAGSDPRGRIAITISSACTRVTATWCRVMSAPAPPSGCAMKAEASALGAKGCTSTLPMPSSAWASMSSASATAICSRCMSASPVRTPIKCRCASTRRSITPWADYGWIIILMSTIPGLYVIGEANFSDHGANRLGASA